MQHHGASLHILLVFSSVVMPKCLLLGAEPGDPISLRIEMSVSVTEIGLFVCIVVV